MLSRCGLFPFDGLSGEVKHFVHLIRWNLTAVVCQLGQELTTVPVQGIIARPLSIQELNPAVNPVV